MSRFPSSSRRSSPPPSASRGSSWRAKRPTLDRDVVREMGALGLIGADLPERYGGLGESSVTAGLLIEAVAYADFNLSYVPLLASLVGDLIAVSFITARIVCEPSVAMNHLPIPSELSRDH